MREPAARALAPKQATFEFEAVQPRAILVPQIKVMLQILRVGSLFAGMEGHARTAGKLA